MIDPSAFSVTLRRPSGPTVASLPIATRSAGSPGLLVDGDNRPVWPVNGGHDRSAVEACAKLFGGATHTVQTQPRTTSARTSGEVIGLGDIEEETRLYAHLTGRDWRLVTSAGALPSEALPEVILLAAPRLDADLVQHIMLSPVGAIATGIVWGRTRKELAQQVLIRAGTAVMNGPVARRRADLVYLDSTRPGQSDPRRDSDPEVKPLMSGGAGVLTVVAHGDESRVILGERLALCPRDQAPSYADPVLAPLCRQTGFCHTVSLPVTEAFRTGRLMTPEQVSARILVMASCRAAFVGSATVDSAWSSLARLVNNPAIGALVASPEMLHLVRSNLSSDLVDVLATGVPVGRALAEFHRTTTVREFDQRLLLFGDPRVRAGPQRGAELTVHRTRSHRLHAPAQDKRLSSDPELSFIRRLALYIRDDMQDVATATSHRAVESLKSYELTRESGKAAAAAGVDLREALLTHLGTMKARIWSAWMNHTGTFRSESIRDCPSCGWLVRPSVSSFESSDHERMLVNCPRCGIVVDKPTSSDLGVSVSLPQVELHGSLPPCDWTAAVFLVPEIAKDTQIYLWPPDPTGAPARTHRLMPQHWPSGPLVVQFVLIVRTSVHNCGAPARAPHCVS
jgi:hypothetical protein